MSFVKYFSPGSKKCSKYKDEDLANMIRKGGLVRRTAINCLHERLFYMVGRMLSKHRVLRQEEAHEAFADSIISLIDVLLSDREIEDLRKFFYTIFSRKCIDIIRKNTTTTNIDQKIIPFSRLTGKGSDKSGNDLEQIILNKSVSVTETDEAIDAGPVAERNLLELQSEARQKIKRSFDKLRDKCRQILKYQWDNYSMDEIAAKCDIQTPRQTAYNCRKNLAKYLAKEGLTLEELTDLFENYQQEFYQLLSAVDNEVEG